MGRGSATVGPLSILTSAMVLPPPTTITNSRPIMIHLPMPPDVGSGGGDSVTGATLPMLGVMVATPLRFGEMVWAKLETGGGE